LAEGEIIRRLAAQYGVSATSIRRHREHVRDAIQRALEKKDADIERSVLSRIRNLNREALSILAEARQEGQRRDAIAAIHTLHRLLELEARLLGELAHERPQVQVNVLASPEWLAIRGRLLEALRPYPEAAHAAAKVLLDGHRD
jgi:hypothetical protein